MCLVVPIFMLSSCIETDLQDPVPESLQIINIEGISFRVTGTYPLEAEYSDDAGEKATVPITWGSSDPSILAIEGSTATAISEGTTNITATVGALQTGFIATVLESRESITISPICTTIKTGTSSDFSVNYMNLNGANQAITPMWTSSNRDIAIVDSNGKVTGISEGSVSISTTHENVSDMISVEITDAPVMCDPIVILIASESFMTTGDTFTFIAEYRDANGVLDPSTSISWSSSNTSALSIDENGLVTALAMGSSIITASSGDASVTINVTIESPPITERTGSLSGTGYDISGTFRLFMDDGNDLILSVSNYNPDGPGPYFYFSNQATNVASGLKIADAKTGGNFIYNISDLDPAATLFTYDYLVVWCEPFSVRLGIGKFDN